MGTSDPPLRAHLKRLSSKLEAVGYKVYDGDGAGWGWEFSEHCAGGYDGRDAALLAALDDYIKYAERLKKAAAATLAFIDGGPGPLAVSLRQCLDEAVPAPIDEFIDKNKDFNPE
jgi:hypothetical protein